MMELLKNLAIFGFIFASWKWLKPLMIKGDEAAGEQSIDGTKSAASADA